MKKKIIKLGLKVANSKISQEGKIWSRYSRDKVDTGETLAKVIRTLSKAFALSKDMSALSIGSSNEPQFRLLETAFRRGLYLFDIEKEALDIVRERIHRQCTDHVQTILGDYNKFFLDSRQTARFLKSRLDGQKMDLITLHHCLYYCQQPNWNVLLENLYRQILAPKGAIHAVLMAAESKERYTTGWLYNHFAGKFFGHHNDQNLQRFKRELQNNHFFKKAQILTRRSRIRFFVDDFEKFMAVIWMILLYPGVHPYNLQQRKEIVEFSYNNFWKKKRPLIQLQDHLVIYRGLGVKGLI